MQKNGNFYMKKLICEGEYMFFCAKKANAGFIRHNPGVDSAVTFWLKIPKAGHEYQQAHRHVRDPIGNLS